MPQKNTISCDIKGCKASEELTIQAGTLEGWITRVVTDNVRKRLVDGMHDFPGSVRQYLCPKHAEQGSALPAPATHPEVVEFKNQPDSKDGSGQ